MNTKTAPESCPFCGAGKKRHLPHIAFRWFECGTMTAPAKTPRRDQTPACADAERERLTQERDDLLARVKRLEEAGQRVDDAAHSVQDWSGTALRDALDELNKAKEAKP